MDPVEVERRRGDFRQGVANAAAERVDQVFFGMAIGREVADGEQAPRISAEHTLTDRIHEFTSLVPKGNRVENLKSRKTGVSSLFVRQSELTSILFSRSKSDRVIGLMLG